MKKTIFYLSAVALNLFILTSCSNDDNAPEPQTQDNLIGKWNLNTISVKISVDGEVVQDIVDQPAEGSMTMQFDFKTDNTVDYYFGDEEGTEEGKGTYQKNGNNLTITIDNEPATFVITLNDKTNLHFGNSDEYEEQGYLIKEEIGFKFIKM